MAVTDELSYTVLSGPPIPAPFRSLEEIVRPFGIARRGIAFVDDGGRLELSYADLAERTAHAAARLRRSGVSSGARVAMTLTNDLESVLAVLGTWACGATVVSLPSAPRNDNGWYARQFEPVLDTMACEFEVTGEPADLTGPADSAPAGSGRRQIAKQAVAEPVSERVALADVAVPDTALIQFTSGSLGAPKGVAVGGRALASHIAAMIEALSYQKDTDKIVSWLPLRHDMGLVAMFLTGLAARMDLVIASPRSFATRPASWLTMLATERATVTAAPSFAYRLAAAVPYRESLDLSGMRVCVSGGERIDWQTMLDFSATVKPMGFDWGAVMPCYGLAESTVGVSYTPLGRGPLRGPDGNVSTGVPLPGVDVRVPAGSQPGPIEIRGEACLSGYYTGQGFEPVPVGEWFDTGDAGFVHDGELYVLGRRNEVLSLAGRNIFAEDVESVIYETCGQLIGACAAFRNPARDGRFGLMAEANPRLVRDPDAAIELARQIQACVTQAVETRLSPVLITRMGTIPRTSSGKVQRAQCRSLYTNGQITRRVIAELA